MTLILLILQRSPYLLTIFIPWLPLTLSFAREQKWNGIYQSKFDIWFITPKIHVDVMPCSRQWNIKTIRDCWPLEVHNAITDLENKNITYLCIMAQNLEILKYNTTMKGKRFYIKCGELYIFLEAKFTKLLKIGTI